LKVKSLKELKKEIEKEEKELLKSRISECVHRVMDSIKNSLKYSKNAVGSKNYPIIHEFVTDKIPRKDYDNCSGMFKAWNVAIGKIRKKWIVTTKADLLGGEYIITLKITPK
jgi:hypothetical protein